MFTKKFRCNLNGQENVKKRVGQEIQTGPNEGAKKSLGS